MVANNAAIPYIFLFIHPPHLTVLYQNMSFVRDFLQFLSLIRDYFLFFHKALLNFNVDLTSNIENFSKREVLIYKLNRLMFQLIHFLLLFLLLKMDSRIKHEVQILLLLNRLHRIANMHLQILLVN